MQVEVAIATRLEKWHAASRALLDLERDHRARCRLPRLDDSPEQRQEHKGKIAEFNAAHAAESAAHVAIWDLVHSGEAPCETVRLRYCASIRERKQRGDYAGGNPSACRPEEIRT